MDRFKTLHNQTEKSCKCVGPLNDCMTANNSFMYSYGK